MSAVAVLLGDVRDFIASLGRELPDLFAPKPPAWADAGAREKARAVFTERAAFWAARMGETYGRVFIKDQRTLWGSCSAEGNLNFNWRVSLAPPEIIDYLVIHELAHRREMNHSRRFWARVAAFCPGWREHRRWLREHERELKSHRA